MAEYDIKFAEKLASVAEALLNQDTRTNEQVRVATYLCRLSMEISLKSVLESTRQPIKEIKNHWHSLTALLNNIEEYEFLVEKSGEDPYWEMGANIKNLSVNWAGHDINMEIIIKAEQYGASIYPNEIRYGDNVKDIAPEILTLASNLLVLWASERMGTSKRITTLKNNKPI